MATLGPARRLVGEDARGVEAVGRDLVRRRQQLPAVVRRDQAEGRVRAAVQQCLCVNRLQLAVRRGADAARELEPAAPGKRRNRPRVVVRRAERLRLDADVDLEQTMTEEDLEGISKKIVENVTGKTGSQLRS